LLNSAGNLALINGSLERILGYANNELIGRSLTTYSYQDDWKLGPNLFEEVVTGKRQSFQLEKRYRHKAGHAVWVNVMVTAMHERGADAMLAIAVLKDITARKQAEEQLHHQLSLTQAIISSFRGGLCALDRDGRVTFLNPAAEQIIGWREEEIIGRPLADMILAPIHEGYITIPDWSTATQHGQLIANDDAIFLRRDGSTFPAGFTLAPIMAGGAVSGAILGFRDLTEQKRMQGELTAVNRLLAESREQAQQHLARELHDGALQVLIGISYQLGRRLNGGPDEDLREVRHSVLDVVAQLRALLGELRPAGLDRRHPRSRSISTRRR
jgi:PAS domain S-box-containing protein